MEPKNPIGRPTKYTPEMCDIVEKCGEAGGTVTEMAQACGVVVSTLYEWEKNHPDFSESFTRAQEMAETFFARRLRDGLALPPSEFQGAANLKYMAQRFQERWSEKQKLEHSGPSGEAMSFIINLVPSNGKAG